MSIKHEKILSVGSDPQENNSVYDFLYHDARRIASFLAQFDKHGHLTGLVRTSGVSETAGTIYGVAGGVGIPTVANLSASGGNSVLETDSDQAAKTYDPLWQNSLALLDYLTQRNLIHRDLKTAKLGQFALVTGRLIVMDVAMIRAVIVSKRGAAQIAKSIQEDEIKKQKESGKPAKSKKDQDLEFALTAEMIQGMFQSFPSAVVMHLIGDEFGIWSSLIPEGLSVSVDDLLLKHGGAPAGEWSVVGIIDALPNAEPLKTDPYFEDDTSSQGIATLFTNLRPKIGRPDKAYGMTPLLIFREAIGH